jgi:hypothetical protein
VDEWDGLDETGDGAEAKASNSDSDSDSEEEMEHPVDSLLTSLGPRLDAKSKGELSKRAALFFDRPDFEGIDTDEVEDLPIEIEHSPEMNPIIDGDEVEESASENGFEEIPATVPEPDPWDDDSDEDKSPAKAGIRALSHC